MKTETEFKTELIKENKKLNDLITSYSFVSAMKEIQEKNLKDKSISDCERVNFEIELDAIKERKTELLKLIDEQKTNIMLNLRANEKQRLNQ